eukprot:6174421-Pleurochrysis_carterae.AAC.2
MVAYEHFGAKYPCKPTQKGTYPRKWKRYAYKYLRIALLDELLLDAHQLVDRVLLPDAQAGALLDQPVQAKMRHSLSSKDCCPLRPSLSALTTTLSRYRTLA